MGRKSLISFFRKSLSSRRVRRDRRWHYQPAGQLLEGRQLLAAAIAVSAVQQYGIPSVFAIGITGNVSYNFLTVVNGAVNWNGWTQVPGGVGAESISTGTVLPKNSAVVRPFVFMINSAENVYYNSINSSSQFNGWTPVGINVGAALIASGSIPITSTPYVVMINGNHDIYYNSGLSNGGWAGWTPVGIGDGAVEVATGVIQVSQRPVIYEPYVVMMNTARDVWYKVRNTNGTWGNWSPVGIGVGAASISATTILNQPNVSMLNTAGNIYINVLPQSGSWLGWSPVGGGTGSGALPAVSSLAILSSFNNYEFALNPDGELFSAFGQYARWSTWFGVGSLPSGVGAAAFAATSPPSSVPFAFVIGTDGNVYWADQTAWASWSTFASLGAPD